MKKYVDITSLNKLLIFALLGVLLSCSSAKSGQPDSKDEWADKLADAVMARNDSLAIYNNPPSIRWNYDLGMLGRAISELKDQDQHYFDYNKNYIDLFIDDKGDILTYREKEYNLDDLCAARNLLDLYTETNKEKYLIAIHKLLNQLQHQPRTSNGGYCHKEIYMHQIWLNSAYMVEPFLAQYAAEFDQPQWFDTVSFQLINTYNLTVDKKDGLLVHAWDESKNQNWADPVTGKSPHKWGRGMGWYTMGLVDVLQYFPEDHPGRKELESILQDVSKALLNVRDKETGLWYQILDEGDREYNYIETSASAMFIYSFAKGANLGVLPKKYWNIADESFDALVDNYIKTDIDNLPTLIHVSGSAGLGIKKHRDGSFEYYINQQQVDNDPKGMAPLIYAAVELKR